MHISMGGVQLKSLALTFGGSEMLMMGANRGVFDERNDQWHFNMA